VKSLFYILIGALLFFKADGLVFFLKVQQYYVQHEMQEWLSANDPSRMENLTLTDAEYKASRISNKEMLYKGKLFDIKSAVYKNGQVILKVIHDTREQNIISFISGIKSSSHRDTADSPVKLKSSQPFNGISPIFTRQSFVISCSKLYFNNYLVQSTSHFSQSAVPPPEWC